ncbi:MAG: hypothetical protein ACI33S_04545 [Bacilli bacterium]
MENKLINKLYNISRIIIPILTFIIFNIMLINEDESWNILPPIFALITFGISFPSSIISKKIISIGDKIKNKIIKVLFYIVVLPIVIFILFLLIYSFVLFIYYFIPNPSDFASALGQALLALFFVAVGTICIIVPYVQTLIVIILKQFIKK